MFVLQRYDTGDQTVPTLYAKLHCVVQVALMSSESFRRQLQQEANQWQAEELISSDQLQQLANRYQFEQLETDARDRFVGILLVIGGLLLGIGVITFVAANWQAIPRLFKMLLLLALLIGVNIAGFSLWRSPRSYETLTQRSLDSMSDRQQWQQRLGHGLFIFGALALGANIALMGQMFHLDGSAFGLCFLWGIGVLVMAYGLQLASLGVVAVILINIGFWSVVFNSSVLQQGTLMQSVCQFMPLVIGGLFLPLAYQCRSRLLFALTAIGVVSTFEAVVASVGDRAGDAGGVLWAIALSLPIALLWAYPDSLGTFIGRMMPTFSSQGQLEEVEPDVESMRRFRPVARAIAFLWLSLTVYGLSFNSWIYSSLSVEETLSERVAVFLPLLLNPNFLILGGLAIAFWVCLGWPRIGNQWRLTLTDGVILLILLVMAVLVTWHGAIASIGVYGTLVFNILLFLLSVGAVREGLSRGDRKQFWVGLVLMILHILSRVFEYDTGLIVKSLAFLLCGIAIMVIGLWFERYVRALPVAERSS